MHVEKDPWQGASQEELKGARIETNGCEVERHKLQGNKASERSCDLRWSFEAGQGSSNVFAYIGSQDFG